VLQRRNTSLIFKSTSHLATGAVSWLQENLDSFTSERKSAISGWSSPIHTRPSSHFLEAIYSGEHSSLVGWSHLQPLDQSAADMETNDNVVFHTRHISRLKAASKRPFFFSRLGLFRFSDDHKKCLTLTTGQEVNTWFPTHSPSPDSIRKSWPISSGFVFVSAHSLLAHTNKSRRNLRTFSPSQKFQSCGHR
jgi:hypothetical protein